MIVKVRLPRPWSGYIHGYEKFSAHSGDKQTRKYDREGSNHHPSLSTLRPKVLSCGKIKWGVIYAKIHVKVTVRLPHPLLGDSRRQQTFLAPSPDKQTRSYDTEWSKPRPSLSTQRPKWLSCRTIKLWNICTNLPGHVIVRLPHFGAEIAKTRNRL